MLLGDSAYGSGEAWAERRGADPIIHNPAGPAANPCQQALTCPQAATGAGNAARQQADPGDLGQRDSAEPIWVDMCIKENLWMKRTCTTTETDFGLLPTERNYRTWDRRIHSRKSVNVCPEG